MCQQAITYGIPWSLSPLDVGSWVRHDFLGHITSHKLGKLKLPMQSLQILLTALLPIINTHKPVP